MSEPSANKTTTTTATAREITIYAMPGSQYTAKVLVALDARKIPHFCEFVSMDPKARRLPSGGTMVPEMEVRTGTANIEPIIVNESEEILRWLDQNVDDDGAGFFPHELAGEVSVRASDGILAGAVLYYNWIDPEGYKRSMNRTIASMLPPYIPFFREVIVDMFMSSHRKKYKTKSASMMNLDEDALTDEPRVYRLLLDELTYFQSLLRETNNEEDRKVYFIGGDNPTAADFSVYAQVERLVGDVGDAKVFPSKPALKTETPDLRRFWDWHEHMRENFPIRFKGKRRPRS